MRDFVATPEATYSQRCAAVKREAQQGGTGSGEADDDDCVIVEGGGAAEGHSGFYRAARETGRANILLVLQARCWDVLGAPVRASRERQGSGRGQSCAAEALVARLTAILPSAPLSGM